MNITSWDEWLKNTVPGILVLGVISSFLAIWVGKIAKAIFLRLIPDGFSKYLTFLKRISYKHGYVVGFFTGTKDSVSAIIYFSYHLLRTFMFFIVASLSLLLFLFLLMIRTGQILNIGTYFSILTFLLSVYAFMNEYKIIQLAYSSAFKDIFTKAETKALERYKEKPDIENAKDGETTS